MGAPALPVGRPATGVAAGGGPGMTAHVAHFCIHLDYITARMRRPGRMLTLGPDRGREPSCGLRGAGGRHQLRAGTSPGARLHSHQPETRATPPELTGMNAALRSK